MSTIIGEISIPADDQGFVLMQCTLCGEFLPSAAEQDDYFADWIIQENAPVFVRPAVLAG